MTKTYTPEEIGLDFRIYEFLRALLDFYNRWEIGISGCGDCGSPYLDDKNSSTDCADFICYISEKRAISFRMHDGRYKEFTLHEDGSISSGRVHAYD